jgi:biotin carboxylase
MFRTFSNEKDYILLLKADEFLRDRSIVAAIRNFRGMIFGMGALPPLNRVRVFDHVLSADPHRPSDALRAVRAFAEVSGMVPKAVIPITEMTLETAFEIAKAYNIPFLSRETVEAARDKAKMKEAFSRNNVSIPKGKAFANIEELRIAASELGFPVIVKPTRAAHSIGIRKIDKPEDIEAGFEYCRSGLDSIASAWGIERDLFQVEQYIDADREVSVEVVNSASGSHVVAVTDKFLTPPPYFAEIGHLVPSNDTENERVRLLAINACQALGINYGVAHVEIRIDHQGDPYVIEVAARPGGDGIMDLVERSYGINLYDLHIRSYLGLLKEGDWRAKQVFGTAAIAFMPSKTGRVVQVQTPKQLPREVTGLYLNAKVGDQVGRSLNYDDRLGTVEYFWEGRVGDVGSAHLDIAKRLRDEIYNIES